MLANKAPKPYTIMPPPTTDEKMITTPEFIAKMDELKTELLRQSSEMARQSAEMSKQADDRHRSNGVTHAVMNEVYLKTTKQDVILDAIVESQKRIESCLLGDEKFKQIGLITTVLDLTTRNTAFEVRLSALESQVKTHRWAAILVFSVLGVVGAVITWLKATGFFKFFTS